MSGTDKEAENAAALPAKGRPYRWLWAIGLGLYLGALWYFGWPKVWESLTSLDAKFIVAVVGVEAASIGLRAAKWRYVLGKGRNAVGLFFLSKAGGAVTPMRLGELSPLVLRQHRNPRLGAWIVLDRLLEMSATLVLGAIGVVALGIAFTQWFLAMAVAACGLIMIPAYVVTKRTWFLWLASRGREGSRLARVAGFLAGISVEFRVLWKHVPVAAVMTITVTCLDLVSGILVYRGFGRQLTFAVAAAAQCAHALATVVPFTPNATGIPFAAAAAVIHEFGHIPYMVVVATVPVIIPLKVAMFWTLAGLGALAFKKDVT